MSDLQKAQLTFNRINKMLKVVIVIAIVYAITVLTVLAIQTYHVQISIADNQITNRAASEERLVRALQGTNNQHEVTQEYISCVATVLLKPIETREASDFDNCAVIADDTVKE